MFGAEGRAECLNPILWCAAGNWAHYTVFQHVLPRAMQLDAKGNYMASPLLAQAPSLLNAGISAGPPFTVTFRVSPEARWDDGSPITARDFRFTWLAILHTAKRGIPVTYRAQEYANIMSVDARDPRAAVVRFHDVYVNWPDLFGGLSDYVLKASAFPHADPRAPNLIREMLTGIPFSGGPFKLESWTEQKAVLVRNDRYFGTLPLLDRVTFVSTLTSAREGDLLFRGTVSAIYPTPWSIGSSLEGAFHAPNIRTLGGDGLYFEALWINQLVAPLDDPFVRAALMYAIDRQAVIDHIVKPWNPNARVLNCGFVAFPDIGPWCRTHPFERFTYDSRRALTILEADGYSCSVLPCIRNGTALEIPFSVWSTNERRLATQRLLIERAKPAGFLLTPRYYEPGGLGGDPLRNAALSIWATGGTIDPSVTELFGCDELPTPENFFYGSNRTRWCNSEADGLMRASDHAVIPEVRLTLMDRIYQLEADEFVSLPLFVQPAVTAWRTNRIAGPIGVWNSSPYGTFFNMNEWYLAR